MRFGSKAMIWRQSSEPIEPPAPVTRSLTGEVAANLLLLEVDNRTAEEILVGDVARIADAQAAFDDHAHTGQDLEFGL